MRGDAAARLRLCERGVEALSDAELLIVLAGGQRFPLAWAERLLSDAGGLKPLLVREAKSLSVLGGMGLRRAARLLASVELGRRLQRAQDKRPRLSSPEEIHLYLAPRLAALRREIFHVLSFNTRNVLLDDTQVAEGTASACPVDPGEVFRAALHAGATAIVVAHNHPSGDPEPSTTDVALTHRLCEAGGLLGVRVLDHLIIGDQSFTSLYARGLLPSRPRPGPRSAFLAGQGSGG